MAGQHPPAKSTFDVNAIKGRRNVVMACVGGYVTVYALMQVFK